MWCRAIRKDDFEKKYGEWKEKNSDEDGEEEEKNNSEVEREDENKMSEDY